MASIDEESGEALSKLMETFQAADTNGDGVLQREELRALLEAVGDGREAVPMRWVTEPDLDKIFRQYDADGDGVISFAEFQALANDKVLLARALSEYRAAFDAVDTGGNGTISPTELYRILAALDSPLKDYERIVRLMERYDLDGNGQLDFGEFLRLCRDEAALPLAEILAYAGMPPAPAPAPAPAARAAATSAAAPGAVTSFFAAEEFEAAMAAHPDKLVVVMASLTWCRPCKKIVPAFDSLAAAYPGALLLKFYGNSNDGTKALFKDVLKVRVTPAFFFFRDKALVGSCTGANAPRLEGNLRGHLPEDQRPAEALFPPVPAPAAGVPAA
jgi:Ca2+-binding EF-hand superfamily protein